MTMKRSLLAMALATFIVAPTMADPLPTCSGPNRAARGLTCVVDGDTGWHRGVKWRTVGIDAPEISKPECGRESALGVAARDRLRDLMGSGYELTISGADRSQRALVAILLSDGRDAGDVLLAEGLAQPWPNEGNRWCGR